MNKSRNNKVNYKDLPDFCNQDVVFSSMIMAEIIAILLSVVQSVNLVDKFVYLAMASMLIQWILIISLVLLCKTGKYLVKLAAAPFYLTIFLVLQGVTLLVSISASLIISYLQLFQTFSINWHINFLFQNLIISIFVSLIIVRYIFLNRKWKYQVIQQTQNRLDALQARIRPHFLFNSLNSIAALVHIDANKADKAILNLSEIFRSSINDEMLAKFSDEIQLVERYLSIEQLRLEERLQISWEININNQDIKVPALILQPLVENAIYHGIEKLEFGGIISIHLKTENGTLNISISNPVPLNGVSHKGNKAALKNISERLKLIYENKATFKALFDEQNALFIITISIPV